MRSSSSTALLRLSPGVESLFDYRMEHLTITDYDPHPGITFDIAV